MMTGYGFRMLAGSMTQLESEDTSRNLLFRDVYFNIETPRRRWPDGVRIHAHAVALRLDAPAGTVRGAEARGLSIGCRPQSACHIVFHCADTRRTVAQLPAVSVRRRPVSAVLAPNGNSVQPVAGERDDGRHFVLTAEISHLLLPGSVSPRNKQSTAQADLPELVGSGFAMIDTSIVLHAPRQRVLLLLRRRGHDNLGSNADISGLFLQKSGKNLSALHFGETIGIHSYRNNETVPLRLLSGIIDLLSSLGQQQSAVEADLAEPFDRQHVRTGDAGTLNAQPAELHLARNDDPIGQTCATSNPTSGGQHASHGDVHE